MPKLFNPFIFLLIVSLCVSCSYRALPVAQGSKDRIGNFQEPTMSEARNQAPKFATPAVHKDDKSDTERQPSAAKNKQKTAETVLPDANEEQAVSVDSYRDPDNAQAEVSDTPVRVSSVSREQDHLSFTSYNPFENSGSSFSVDLNQEAASFHYPIDGHLLSPYGRRGRGWHSGCDLKGQAGDPIYAAFDGVVRMAKYYGGYGYIIAIRHENGLETAYGHNSKNLVRVGDQVKAGQKIALCGQTGRASGTHCHFEIRILGKTINPALLLNTPGRTLQEGVLTIRRSGNNITASRNGSGTDNITRPAPPKDTFVAQHTSPDNTSPDQITTQPAKTIASTPTAANNTYHRVVSGDTLGALARKYHTTVKQLCQWNKITEKTLLQLKQKLRVK